MRPRIELAENLYKLNTSLWFRPTIMTITSGILAFVTVEIDKRIGFSSVGMLASGVDDARAILSSITSSMLTVTTVTFSIMMVALVLASQQFSPRIIRNVMRDTPSQYVLGAFIGTFVYSLLVLGRVTNTENLRFVPIISLATSIIMTMIAIAAFIYFIHHIAETIQAHELIAQAGDRTLEVMKRHYPERLGVGITVDQAPELPATEPVIICSRKGGYVQAIDPVMLLRLAQDHDLVIEMLRTVGDFVPKGNPLMRMWERQSEPSPLFFREHHAIFEDVFELGRERTLFDDVLFGLRQMVDIALKAISPAINDPNTASNAIDHIGNVLVQATRHPDPLRYRVDDQGILRVIVASATFSDMLNTSLNQIRHYSSAEPTITSRLLNMLNEVAFATDDPDRRGLLWKHALMIVRSADRNIHEPYDRQRVNQRLTTLADTLGMNVETKLLDINKFQTME
ncbi:MAG: DUF2254 domain-containing protein [Herpetosiphon sp.]|nr:DUF2254 domain-containing protein [Herpetosiphon sp.]